jgi:hypothetical protein
LQQRRSATSSAEVGAKARESTWRNATKAVCAALWSSMLACGAPARPTPLPRETPRPSGAISKDRVRALREREAPLRDALSPREQPPWIDVSGADPYRIVPVPGGGFVGVLRGARALVALDRDLGELGRAPLAQTPTALCASSSGDAWVASRYGSALQRARLGPSGAVALTLERQLASAGVADLACGEGGVVYVLPADGSALLTLDQDARELGRYPALPGALRLLRRGSYLLEISLFERTLRVLQLGARGLPARELGRIVHDGTLWAAEMAAPEAPVPLLAVSGAEDKALVRAHGEFENIDSFVWIYELRPEGVVRVAELDVSDFGLVLPKALHLDFRADGVQLDVLAAGSGRRLHAAWGRDWEKPPKVWTEPALPGVSDAVFGQDGSVAYASPLFDAWIKLDTTGARVARVDPERRPSPDVRLGEALFFTELMAPDNSSTGTHSRFSCETCHFEGGVDGRLHYTGRADISVVTKPLFGLANNRPHFSRAMDPDLSSVSHNEFRVAGAGSGQDPWFTLATARFPWLHELGIARAELSPLELRSALLQFLYAFTPAPNASTQGLSHFSRLEAEGAEAFRQHCQSCHAPRLLSDDAASEAPFVDWQSLIFTRNAPLVWARADYAKTGVVPYVHERGTRITSLRRLALKPRYFTNGSAPQLADVVERFRESPEGGLHDAPPGSPALSAQTRRALVAFLRLL